MILEKGRACKGSEKKENDEIEENGGLVGIGY
jgi:hypothetical protein